jgi:tetratricopeptide (TPR) repeat protein
MKEENNFDFEKILDLIKNSKIKDFYEKYQNWIISVGFSLILISFLVIVVMMKLHQTKVRAEEKIAVAESYFYTGRFDDGMRLLDEIINTYKNTKYFSYAMYLKANSLYEHKNFEQAKKVCLEILSFKKTKNIIVPTMYILAQCYQNLNNFDEAIKVFNDIVKEFPDHYLTPRVYESLGFCYELKGDLQKAKEIYERMNILYPGTYWASIAQQKLVHSH